MYRLLTAFYEPYNENSRQKFWNFRLGQISHVVLSHYIEGGGGERGEGGEECVKITFIASFLEWLTC